MKSRLSLLLCAVILSGCADLIFTPPKDGAKPSKPDAPVVSASAGPLCAATAKRLEAGHWDYTQRLYNSVKDVAKDDGVTLPSDFESAMKPYIDKDLLISADMRTKLIGQFKAWGK
jgi:hypothetical protein